MRLEEPIKDYEDFLHKQYVLGLVTQHGAQRTS